VSTHATEVEMCYKEVAGKSHILISENWAIDILSLSFQSALSLISFVV